MTSVNSTAVVPREHEMQIRVRYQETDAQGRVHHSNYINYFEVARVEMLRQSGISYRELEESGVMLVVSSLNCNYIRGAAGDDLLTIKTTVKRAKGVPRRLIPAEKSSGYPNGCNSTVDLYI